MAANLPAFRSLPQVTEAFTLEITCKEVADPYLQEWGSSPLLQTWKHFLTRETDDAEHNGNQKMVRHEGSGGHSD